MGAVKDDYFLWLGRGAGKMYLRDQGIMYGHRNKNVFALLNFSSNRRNELSTLAAHFDSSFRNSCHHITIFMQ